MLDWLIANSLRARGVVLFLALVVGGFGLFQAATAPIDVLPDLNRPVVTVMTEGAGLLPVDIEQRITWPIEQVVNGASGVYRVRSQSGMGLSVVNVDFDWGVDVFRARQIVYEKLQLALPLLPEEARPTLAPISSIMGQVQVVGFQAGDSGLDADALRRLVDVEVRPRVVGLPGVAQAIAVGGQPSELQVIVRRDDLVLHGVTLAEVALAAEQADATAEGATIELGARGPLVGVRGRIGSPEDLARALVRDDPRRPVRIADVADVALAPAVVRIGDAGIDGGPGVLLVIAKQPGEDTLELTRRVDAELERIAEGLPEGVEVRTELFRQAAFIERAIHNVMAAVRDGGVLVVIVLFLFLLNLRTTLITLTAIPLSVAVASLVFAALGLTINTMTLGGLAVAIGTLVDDAIVDVENVYRRLHQNARSASPRPIVDTVFAASSEVRRPVLYGTLLVTVVYLPLFLLSGIEGRLFAPIGLAYITSVGASLLVALTVTPVLCFYLLAGSGREDRGYGGRVVGLLHRVAEGCVSFSLRRTHLVAAVCVAGVLAVGAMLTRVGTTFLPAFNEGTAQVNAYLPPDASFATSLAVGRTLEHVALGVDGVASVARRTGRAAGDEHAMPIGVSEAVLNFDPSSERSREEILEDLREGLEQALPGIATETEQPLAHLLSHLLSGVTAQVAIQITGPDLALLRDVAGEVEARVRPVEGVRDLFTEQQVLVDHVRVEPDRWALARAGLSTADLAETVEIAMGGRHLSTFRVGQAAYPVTVQLAAADRAELAQLEGLYVPAADGRRVRLGDVASVGLHPSPSTIQRENVQRRVVVQHNVAGRSLGEVVGDVERALEPVRARLAEHPGHTLRLRGQFEAQQTATRRIALASALVVLLTVAILTAHFRSLRLALLVLLTRPVALLGGGLAVLATGQDLSVATLVGFIALLGIAARNAILLVDHVLHLVRVEGEAVSRPALVRAGQERIVPVLMTALTSGIGLVPLALAADEPGRELLYPVATVLIGGLITNTLLDLLLTPGLLWRTARGELAVLAERATQAEVGLVASH